MTVTKDTHTVFPGDLLQLRDELLMVVAVIRQKLTGSWEAQVIRLCPKFSVGAKFPRDHLTNMLAEGRDLVKIACE